MFKINSFAWSANLIKPKYGNFYYRIYKYKEKLKCIVVSSSYLQKCEILYFLPDERSRITWKDLSMEEFFMGEENFP